MEWGCKAENSVAVIVADWLIGKVAGVESFRDKVMKVNVAIRDIIWEVVSCYCPQAGRSVNEMKEFYELIDKIVTNEALVGGEFNAHVVGDMRGF